jgi:hypothetical protein
MANTIRREFEVKLAPLPTTASAWSHPALP